ncbi:hypothetical protein JYU34_009505 [Plutella xylostella]|uniref:Uncharacterized protein n=1 Tax=Plutella xylostella TaxID=51655 RepID=A0ABQ7QKX6_PLUXY|nr:hypothetical protein JYU34_009505 [Plutella xylostella]
MEHEIFATNLRISKTCRTVKSSKYESGTAHLDNKQYWDTVFTELDGSSRTPSPDDESRRMAEVLPKNLYEKVCRTLNIPMSHGRDEDEVKISSVCEPRRKKKSPMLSYRKTLSIDREMDSDTDVELSPRDERAAHVNIHQEFLRRPERQQVTWSTRYLQPERDDEKTLVRRADDLTDRIAQEFCQYMKELGGDQQSQLFTPKAIKELFQVEFDTHVARSLKVDPRELPAVQERVAKISNAPEKSREAVLEAEITNDIRAERRPDRLTGFGRGLPRSEQWAAPHNDTMNLWRSAKHVPKDLVTLKTVWEGITNLRSVKEYCRWMIRHPEHRRAPYLRSLGLFDPAVLQARLSAEPRPDPTPRLEPPVPIEAIKRRLSTLTGPS